MYDNLGNFYFKSEFVSNNGNKASEKISEKNIIFKNKSILYNEICPFIFYKSLKNSQNHRNILVCGGLQCGKTSMISSLIYKKKESLIEKEIFFSGSRRDEKIIQTTLKLNPVSFFYFKSNKKTCLFNIIDTPGHSNLSDEIESGFRISDGTVLLVDCIEGINTMTKKLLNVIIYFKKKCFIIYSKLDKAIFELKLPPEETVKKINYLSFRINKLISFLGHEDFLKVLPFFLV